MIGLVQVYGVVVSVAPLYVALFLGYASVKWWSLFTKDHCHGINRFICLFVFPAFTFDFTSRIDPFSMAYSLIAADALSKVVTLLAVGAWGKLRRRADDGISCGVTAFSLCTLTNVLVVGVPMMRAMYGQMGEDFVVQLSVVQNIVWYPLVLLFLEYRKSTMTVSIIEADQAVPQGTVSSARTSVNEALPPSFEPEGTGAVVVLDVDAGSGEMGSRNGARRSVCSLVKVVGLKLAANPNVIAVVLGVAWALLASRLKLQLPSLVQGSVRILSSAGTGAAMFNIGIFMAMQKRVIACGARLAVLAMVLRFIAGPAIMALSSFAVGLHGTALQIAIIQAALPQAIASFVYANEYGLHANVIATAVVVGTLASLPIMVLYYMALEYI
ncbi:hypothetical protein MLD38_020683 [Melastoma candidum]|uniref:Uncharacterized protein n=1 Tax=Melastoma candidum TaxID=119954 RepID=A0ACB9QDS6_9MYRT|nr:hypothetical protein MLD38_020683 [Melastoma candidum]